MPTWHNRGSKGSRILRRQVVQRWGQLCWLCRCGFDGPRDAVPFGQDGEVVMVPKAMTLDHVIPRARGGSNRVDNLKPAHLECNMARGRHLQQDLQWELRNKCRGLAQWYVRMLRVKAEDLTTEE